MCVCICEPDAFEKYYDMYVGIHMGYDGFTYTGICVLYSACVCA